MTSSGASTATQTEFSIGMSLLQPTFWDQLTAEQRRSCRRTEHPVNIDGRQAWDVCGVLRDRWDYMFPSIQTHLNSRAAKIFKSRQGRQIEYGFWLYMVGTLTNFRPNVVVSCLYLDTAERVLKVIRERLRCFTPRPGFGYLAISCRITLLMGPAVSEEGEPWQHGQDGSRFRVVVVEGSHNPYPHYLRHVLKVCKAFNIFSMNMTHNVSGLTRRQLPLSLIGMSMRLLLYEAERRG